MEIRNKLSYNLLLFSVSSASSPGRPEIFIPQPAVFNDKVTGNRPKLVANDRLNTRGWSSFRKISCESNAPIRAQSS